MEINSTSADLENQFFISEEIHCDFKLSSDGESIYLWNDEAELTDSVQFEKQRSDISYGRFPEISDNWQYMKPTTPGEDNQSGYIGFAAAPEFNLTAGFYTSSVSVHINSEDENSAIRYTVDGSPVDENSKLYNN